MKYMGYILAGVFFLLAFVAGYFVYPEHILVQEELCWFVWTPDYVPSQLSAPGGLSVFAANFLFQFYRSPLLGALIQSFSLALAFLLLFLFLKKTGLPDSFIWASCIPALAFLCEFTIWFLPAVLQYDLFLLALVLYAGIYRKTTRYLFAAISFAFFCMWMYGAVLIVLYLSFCLIEFFVFKERRGSFYLALMLVFAVLSPFLWSACISSVPGSLRYCFADKDFVFGRYGLYRFLFFIPALFVFLRLLKLRKIEGKINYVFCLALPLLLMAICAYLAIFSFDNTLNEKFLRVQRYAKTGDWKGLLDEIDAEDAEDPNFKPYIALALSASGQLPDKIFGYSFRSPNEFIFPAQETPLSSADFNSLFYYNLNIKNEAIHQTFQANIFSREGASFGFMRRLIDLQIENRNMPIAKKYLDVLSRSSFNGEWVRSRRGQLDKNLGSDSICVHADYIIDNASVMFPLSNIAQADSANRKAIDYLLCGVLLDKDLNHFFTLFDRYCSKGDDIPIHYQEALLLVELMMPDTQATKCYPVSAPCREAFEEFGRLMAQRPSSDSEMKRKYGNTYWYYGFVKNAR